MKGIKILITLFLIGIVNLTFAKGLTCSPVAVKVQDKNFILVGPDPASKKAAQIYFFYNIAKQSLWLDHPVAKKSANAGWSSYIQPQRWSALLLNSKNFVISCAVIKPGEVNYQNCAKVIKVCIPDVGTFESKRKGTYWLAEDKAWEELLSALEKRGIKTSHGSTRNQ